MAKNKAVAPTMMRRFDRQVEAGKPWKLKPGHAALTERTTRYPKTVIFPEEAKRCLKSGQNSVKIGAKCIKGRWNGMPIYTLTLEERATCPSFCAQWHTCYGNKMHFAERLMHGPYLEACLETELSDPQEKHPDGFIVRLHVLGDFYSLSYAVRWTEWLDAFPALHVFGYTSWPISGAIGSFLFQITQERWDRFAVRISGGDGEYSTDVVSVSVAQHRPDLLICPAETGQTTCCGTCALCWQTTRAITFLEH